MKEIKVIIPTEIVNSIQLKDFEVLSMQNVIASLLESHLLDEDDRIMKSPIFIGYQNKLAEIRKEFEQEKDKMIVTYVNEDVRYKITNWNLDYNSCILNLQLAE